MLKFIICALAISTSAFASESFQLINNAQNDLAVYLADKGESNCSLKGPTLRASFQKNGKSLKNDFVLRNRSGVDLSATVDAETSTVTIERGLLFTTDILNLKYEGDKISEVEMIIAAGSQLETVVKCN